MANLRTEMARKLFTVIAVASLWVVACSHTAGQGTASAVATSSDSISPAFFKLPPGVHPVNKLKPTRLRHSRPSYAWLSHNRKRELISFSTPIQHVVVVYMENRTPENLFGVYANSPAPDGTPLGQKLDVVFPAEIVFPPLSPLPLNDTTNPDHGHSGQGFEDKAIGSWANGLDYAETPGPGLNVPSVANYITLIEKFAYANHVLQSNEGPSFDAHQYAIAGQSGGLSDSNITPEGMTDNAVPASPDFSTYAPPGEGTCYSATAPPHGQHVDTVNMYSPYPTPSPSSAPPCVEYQTIFDALVNAQTPPTPEPYNLWQYVAKDTTSIWSAPMAIEHLYTAYSSDASDKSQQPFAVDPDAENLVLNITGSVSPTPNPTRPFAWLTYITPCVPESDHPNHLASDGSGVDNGPEWLAWLLNAIGSSSYWDSTAVIVTWDDWGGFYDGYRPTPWPYHPTPNPYGPPPLGNPHDPNEWGFRVPMIVISPYVKSRNYVATELESQ